MDSISRKAYAKINLTLDVVAKRADGFHDLRTVMQTVDLYDTLTFTKEDTDDIVLKTDAPGLAADESNLVVRAWRLLKEHAAFPGGVSVFLQKEIPMEAGLAGGSADAACTLKALNELFSLRLSGEKLHALAALLGSDIPFCLDGGTQLAEGRGEVLTQLPAPPPCTVLLAKPAAGVSTAKAYRLLDERGAEQHPDTDAFLHALERGRLQEICGLTGNVFEAVIERQLRAVADLRNLMLDYGALCARMSGSGPTVFGLFREESEAVKAYHVLKSKGRSLSTFSCVTRFL